MTGPAACAFALGLIWLVREPVCPPIVTIEPGPSSCPHAASTWAPQIAELIEAEPLCLYVPFEGIPPGPAVITTNREWRLCVPTMLSGADAIGVAVWPESTIFFDGFEAGDTRRWIRNGG